MRKGVYLKAIEEEERTPRWIPAALVLVLVAAGLGMAGYGWLLREEHARAERAEEERASLVQRRAAAEAEARALVEEAERKLASAVDARLLPGAAEAAAARAACLRAAARAPWCREAARGAALTGGLEALLAGKEAECRARLAGVDDDDGGSLGPQAALAGYLLGHLDLRAGMPVEAWGEFNRVLHERPDWAAARLGRALADLEMGQEKQALAPLEEAVRQWPARPEVAAAYAWTLEATRGDPAEVRARYARAIEVGARDPRTVERFGTLLLEAGEAERMREDVARMIEGAPDRVDLRLLLGRALLALGDAAGAEASLRRALEIEPRDLDAHLELASLLVETRRFDEAVVLLGTARDLAPADARVLALLGYANLGVGETEGARTAFATSCTDGLRSSCEEACYLDDRESCGRVRPDRAQAVQAELRSRTAGASRGKAYPATGGPSSASAARAFAARAPTAVASYRPAAPAIRAASYVNPGYEAWERRQSSARGRVYMVKAPSSR